MESQQGRCACVKLQPATQPAIQLPGCQRPVVVVVRCATHKAEIGGRKIHATSHKASAAASIWDGGWGLALSRQICSESCSSVVLVSRFCLYATKHITVVMLGAGNCWVQNKIHCGSCQKNMAIKLKSLSLHIYNSIWNVSTVRQEFEVVQY